MSGEGAFGLVYQSVTRRPDIPIAAKGIYAYLAALAGADGSCFPSVERMCTEMGLERHALDRHLKLLERAGVISKELRRANGKRATNLYRLQPEQFQPVENAPVEQNQPVENIPNLLVQNAPIYKEHITTYMPGSTRPEIQEIVDYLNRKTGKTFRANAKATQRLINARLNEGFTIEDFKCVVEDRCAKWRGDSKMEQYLRPETLFNATKFEGYLQAAQQAHTPQDDPPQYYKPGGGLMS